MKGRQGTHTHSDTPAHQFEVFVSLGELVKHSEVLAQPPLLILHQVPPRLRNRPARGHLQKQVEQRATALAPLLLPLSLFVSFPLNLLVSVLVFAFAFLFLFLCLLLIFLCFFLFSVSLSVCVSLCLYFSLSLALYLSLIFCFLSICLYLSLSVPSMSATLRPPSFGTSTPSSVAEDWSCAPNP